MIMLSLLAFERIAKKNGVRRISKEALEETREIIEEIGLETAEHAVKISRFAGKKTVMETDVKFVVEKKA
jgi:histone H3/H4